MWYLLAQNTFELGTHFIFEVRLKLHFLIYCHHLLIEGYPLIYPSVSQGQSRHLLLPSLKINKVL